MNKKLGVPIGLLVVAGLIAAGLLGALIASAVGGDDDDDNDAVVLTTTATPSVDTGVDGTAPLQGSGGQSDQGGQSTPDNGAVTVIDPEDEPISPALADRVAKAAVAAAGGGTVTDLGRSDDPGEAFEIEVQTDTGEVDIALDENLNRVSNNPYDD